MNDRFKFRTYIPDLKFFKYWGWVEKNHYIGLCASGDISMSELLEKYTEQSTGLKDKNGKLIYEGDIIKICCCNLTKIQISDVFFCQERSAFCFHYKTDYGNYANCTMEKTEIEVIGNKFENPELLKECE